MYRQASPCMANGTGELWPRSYIVDTLTLVSMAIKGLCGISHISGRRILHP